MKKTIKKLKVNAEAIRNLSDKGMSLVQGGGLSSCTREDKYSCPGTAPQ